MRMTITARHMELTEAMRDYAEKKLSRLLNKYSRISNIELIIDNEGAVGYKVEVIIKADNHEKFVLSHKEEDMYACIDALTDKSERQLIKHKEKSRNHKGKTGAAEATAGVMDAMEENERESGA